MLVTITLAYYICCRKLFVGGLSWDTTQGNNCCCFYFIIFEEHCPVTVVSCLYLLCYKIVT